MVPINHFRAKMFQSDILKKYLGSIADEEQVSLWWHVLYHQY